MKKLNIDNFFNQCYSKNPIFFNDFESLIRKVLKPARYIGIEPYSYHKYNSIIDKIDKFNSEGKLKETKKLYKIVITYPDLYEIGMSNLTIKYFYEFINRKDEFVCERAFLPDTDLINLLIDQKIPLLSLESWTPVKDFDLWAITLQTELNYTNIIHLIKLANINPLTFDRNEKDPIIIVGGVSVFNPIPLSPFIDLFFIGEGEEGIIEIIELDKINKKRKLNREQRIQELLKIEGVFTFNYYVKNYYDCYIENSKNKIENSKLAKIIDINFLKYLSENIKIPELKGIHAHRRIIQNLDEIDYPYQNILPLVQTVQDRLSCEIARGCLNGCRFCQASYIYRPYREKNSVKVALHVAKSLMLTGYEECNLSGLSVSDYSNIVELMKALEKYLSKKNISLSLPSLRIASFDINLFNSLNSIRKAGLTFAVEAGCNNFRDKINKCFDEDKLIQIIENLYYKGWKLVKLYFIIGFPGLVNEEDKIIEFLEKIKISFPKLNVNASVALLIPKPFTPFFNDQQISINLFLEKVNKIKRKFKNSRISIKYHDPFSSFLEYFFANGSFDSSYILGLAYEENICFDAWDEKKNNLFYDKIDLYSKKPFLIFEKIDLAKIFEGHEFSNFIKIERDKYELSEKTSNCITDGCKSCSICNDKIKNILSNKYNENQIFKELEQLEEINIQKNNIKHMNDFQSFLLRFSKYGLYRYVGHLDFYRTFIRVLRLGGIDFEYTKGFNPMPKIFFPFASPIGLESYEDILIFTCKNEICDLGEFCNIYNRFLPEGFKFEKINKLDSINDWRKNAIVTQMLEIPFSIVEKNKNIWNLDEIEIKIRQILSQKDIEIQYLDFKIITHEFNPEEFFCILYLKTTLKENQSNIIKLLNNFENSAVFDIFSKRKINIEQ